MVKGIREKKAIGMLLIDAIKMKGLMIPSPLRCLDVSATMQANLQFCCPQLQAVEQLIVDQLLGDVNFDMAHQMNVSTKSISGHQ